MDQDTSEKTSPVEHSLPPTLSRKQLTSALVIITLLPFLLVVVLYFAMPSLEDPVLQAEVSVGPAAWPSQDADDARLLPCVILKNPTEGTWNYINMSINDQFHFAHPDPLPPGEQIEIPLTFFHTKGNAYFPPESQRLKELTLYAQIPSGARAILVLEQEELNFDQPEWVQ